jgi:hypothetical protein
MSPLAASAMQPCSQREDDRPKLRLASALGLLTDGWLPGLGSVHSRIVYHPALSWLFSSAVIDTALIPTIATKAQSEQRKVMKILNAVIFPPAMVVPVQGQKWS